MDAGESGTGAEQGTLYLKPFDCEVPLLHTADGDFVPLVSLCELLGLPAAPYASLACQRFRPENAVRRLPFRDSDGSVRQAWCLDQDRVALWLMSLRPERVSTARRDQLLTFQQQALAATSQVYSTMQRDYRATRASLFEWLRAREGWPVRLRRMEAQYARQVSGAAVVELQALMARGYALVEDSAALVRAAVQEMARQPVIDAVFVNPEGEVIDTKAMPLLPVVPDLAAFQQSQERLAAWFDELDAWLAAHGFQRRAL